MVGEPHGQPAELARYWPTGASERIAARRGRGAVQRAGIFHDQSEPVRARQIAEDVDAPSPRSVDSVADRQSRRDAPRAGSRSGRPIAIIDIGSNSVRLVVYEGLTRAPTPLFNEKVLAGLGRGVVTTGTARRGGRRAGARRRSGASARCAGRSASPTSTCSRPPRRATPRTARRSSAAADALRLRRSSCSRARARRSCPRSASSPASYQPDGIVGDLGGGSLELVDVDGDEIGEGITLPLGGLALQDLSEQLADEGAQDRARGARARRAAAGSPRAAPSTPSAAPGARSPGCTRPTRLSAARHARLRASIRRTGSRFLRARRARATPTS